MSVSPGQLSFFLFKDNSRVSKCQDIAITYHHKHVHLSTCLGITICFLLKYCYFQSGQDMGVMPPKKFITKTYPLVS